MINRIAFIFHPYSDEARVDTVPFAKNTLRAVAQAAKEIDLFTWEPPGERPGSLPANIRVHHVRQFRWMNYWRTRAPAHALWAPLHSAYQERSHQCPHHQRDQHREQHHRVRARAGRAH